MTVIEQPPPAPPTVHQLQACVAAIGAALDDVADAACWSLGDDQAAQLLGQLVAVSARVDELRLRVLADTAARNLPARAGATSTAAWLVANHRLSRPAAAVDVRLAVGLDRGCELARRALASGAINADQAAVIVRAVERLPIEIEPEQCERAERWLVEQAAVHGPDGLRRLGRRVFEVIDPEAADAHEARLLEDEEARARRIAWLSMRRRGDGSTAGAFRLPDAQADMLRAALEGLASPRRAGHGGEAAGFTHSIESRDEPLPPYPVRMGRAFAELVEHLPTDGLPQHGGVPATVVVNLDLDALRDGTGAARLSTGTDMSAAQARRLACNAGIIPAVLGGGSVCLDMGRRSRLFTSNQRLACALTQQGCIWRGCDRPAAWCECHHGRRPWSAGGSTDLADGMLLCPRHHHLAHADWTVRFAADGLPEVIPPARVDPQRLPMRHERFPPRRQ